MGVGVFIGMIILLLILVLAPVTYFIFKKYRKPKLGFVIALIMILFVLSVFFMNTIDSVLYSRKDAKEDLRLCNLYLKEDFEILENNVRGMPDRFQKTKLKIADNDRNRIISEIKNDKNFLVSDTDMVLHEQSQNNDAVRNKIVYTEYKYGDEYIRESYYRENDYVPIYFIIRLSEKSDTLKLERIED